MSIKLSYTANGRYQTSPRSWYLYYVRNLRPEYFGSALMFGSAMDIAINSLLRNKQKGENVDVVQTFETMMQVQEYNGEKLKLSKSDKVKYWKSDLDPSIWTKEDEDLAKKCKPEWVTLRRKGLMMIEAYKEQVMPHLGKIVTVQDYVKIENEQGDSIIGWKDFVAVLEPDKHAINYNPSWEKWRGKTIIWDNKTASQKYKDDSVRDSDQLGTYFESPSEEYEADGCGYIVLPKKFLKKKLPQIPIQIIVDDVSEQTVDKIFQQYENTINGIKMGYFPCTSECKKTPWGCDYQKYCDSDGQDLSGLVEVKKK